MTPARTPTLSAAAVASAKDLVGQEIRVWAWNTVASEDAIRHFAFAVGDDNPLWWDRSYAAHSAVGSITAPPTFLYTLMSGGPWPSGDGDGAPDILPGSLGLWAEDRWTWYSRIAVDRRLSARATLWSIEEKRTRSGEHMVAQTELYEVLGGDGERIAKLYRTIMRLEPRLAGQQAVGSSSYRYTQEELGAIDQQYASEPSMRRGARPRFWEDVSIGDPIGPLVKGPLTIGGIVSFMAGLGPPMLPTNRIAYHYLRNSEQLALRHESGVVDPMGAIHIDAELARRAGFNRGYDLGSQRIAWISHAVCDWMGDDARLLELYVRIRRPNLVGDATWISGTVTGKTMEEDGGRVECQITGTNQRGEETTGGRALVALPSRAA